MSDPPAQSATPAKGFILATCCLSLFLIFMDVTIVNVALPAIRLEFHATTASLQWIVDGYTIVVASFLLLAGAMADRFGRRRVLQCGMAIFSISSALCGLAPSATWLIVFRVMQALGGSMLNPVAMAIITNTFLVPRERARAVGIWGSVAGIAMANRSFSGGAAHPIRRLAGKFLGEPSDRCNCDRLRSDLYSRSKSRETAPRRSARASPRHLVFIDSDGLNHSGPFNGLALTR